MISLLIVIRETKKKNNNERTEKFDKLVEGITHLFT